MYDVRLGVCKSHPLGIPLSFRLSLSLSLYGVCGSAMMTMGLVAFFTA